VVVSIIEIREKKIQTSEQGILTSKVVPNA